MDAYRTAGTYYFVASYSGDATNSSTSSACAAEPDHGKPAKSDHRHPALGHHG